MPSQDYLRRLESLIATRVEDQKHASHPTAQRLVGAGLGIAGACALFFVLKAAALAQSDLPLAAPLPAEAGFAQRLHHWIIGPDPVTRTLATAIRPDTAPLPRG